jgi:hypothetical protein
VGVRVEGPRPGGGGVTVVCNTPAQAVWVLQVYCTSQCVLHADSKLKR